MKVMVYRNLHFIDAHVFSIKALEGKAKGRVIGYAPAMKLQNCKLIVSEAGRQRVLKTKRKNVHAGVVGDLVEVCQFQVRQHTSDFNAKVSTLEDWHKNRVQGLPIAYYPYEFPTFVLRGSNKPIKEAKEVNISFGMVDVIP